MENNRSSCDDCKGEDSVPCCAHFKCEAAKGTTGITLCIHCGGELIEVDGKWYHWSQFDNNRTLLSPDNPQDYVT